MAVTLFDSPYRKLHPARELHGSMFYGTGVIVDRSFTLHISNFFCSCDLDFDPMTFIYENNPYTIELYWICENELSAWNAVAV